MSLVYEDAGLRLFHGSNLDVLPTLADESYDSIVTDPPYELGFTERPCCAPWGQRETEHLVLANPRPLAEPIPYKGALGLRRLDEETAAHVWGGIT